MVDLADDLLQPGVFEVCLELETPNLLRREALLEVVAASKKLTFDQSFCRKYLSGEAFSLVTFSRDVAKRMDGYLPADIHDIIDKMLHRVLASYLLDTYHV